MARLAKITIFPIKSFDGVNVTESRVLPSGALEFDRRWAFVDDAGHFINGKRVDRVHRLRARFKLAERQVFLKTDGAERQIPLDPPREALEHWVSEALGIPVQAVENPTHGFPDDTNAPGPTFLSAATIADLAEYLETISPEELAIRLRVNLIVEDAELCWEDRLFADADHVVAFRVGDIVFEGTNPCQRCVTPTRNPTTGESYPGFVKKVADWRRWRLPPWADASRFDHFYRIALNVRPTAGFEGGVIRVGDPFEILDVRPRLPSNE